ncbi:hypothetical protein [Frondihabitans australicus]|uniref:LppP/LprE lipoprotein n=1 Tax=Frondihabitans australicus TaxID=386892 RepID=A0A495IEU4_9MICO|nr:hypothetical protein [Frondihabitans australicus]RKR74008.1 hypothetical protein C8E83_1110 [Frondihabitans australicus]
MHTHEKHRHTLGAGAAALLLATTLAGCTAGATTAQPTTTVTVTQTPSPSATLDVQSALESAPVPALCQHPAGTLQGGTLPGQAESTGYVKLSSIADTGEGPYFAEGSITGVDGEAVAASITCNAGGVPWPDVIVLYAVDDGSLKLEGSYSLGTPTKAESAVTQSVSVTGGSAVVSWTGPGANQPAADGSLLQKASFTVADGRVVMSGYTSSTS